MKTTLSTIAIIFILAFLTASGLTAYDRFHEPSGYTAVYPTGDPKQDAINIRQVVDAGGKALLKSHGLEGKEKRFERGMLDHLKKECTLYMENPDGAMRVLRIDAEALKSLSALDSGMHARKTSQAPTTTHVNTLQLNPVTILEGTEGYLCLWYGLISRPPTTNIESGIDIDSDFRREIVFRTRVHASGPPVQIYESIGDNSFQGYTTSIITNSRAVGDVDSDGLQEIIAGGFDHDSGRAVIEIYEQPDAFSYPSVMTTDFLAPMSHAATIPINPCIDDLDGDHINEIIYAICDPGFFVVHECRGDNIYQEVYLASEPEGYLQKMTITVDLDNDGWKEAIVGGVPYLIMYEAWGDDSYRPIWWSERERNIYQMIYVGDSDGDGLKEFLVASNDITLPSYENCTLYEYDGAGGFDITFEISNLYNPFVDEGPKVEAADFDGDGKRELICARKVDGTCIMEVYKSTGDNQYELVFSSAGVTGDGLAMEHVIGVGDFDRDNKIELVLTEDRGGEDFVIAVYETAQAITNNVLRLTAGYKQSRLCLDFTLGVPARMPAQGSIRWFTALLMPIGPSLQWVPITYTIVPPILPSKDFPVAFSFPQMGWIGVYSALLSDSGIEDFAFEMVNTGGAGLEKAIESEDILSELPNSEAILRALR